ncbi:MAG TPA: DUF2254 domain-containing protein [Microcella sp.]|nr:DUF2254 domain-containing protein [Microcella sp.]
MNRVAFIGARIRDSFWSIPALALLIAIAAAEGLVALDRVASLSGGIVTDIGPEGSRALLSAIATATLAAASTMFSITIAVLTLTASAYGPRIVRSVMADSGNRIVLAMLVATALYALLVLRHVRAGPGEFVPSVSVMVAIAATVVCIALLVYFIHHISTGIQISTLAASVRRELRDRLDEAYPLEGAARLTSDDRWQAPTRQRQVRAVCDGYVADVGLDDLVDAARRHGVCVDLRVRPGTFVVAGDPLAAVAADAPDDCDGAIVRAISLGDERTPYQDVEYLARQLTDIAVRALSTGVNDPHTAIVAIDALLASFAATADRPDPPTVALDDDGVARVRVLGRPWSETIVDAVDTIRVCAADSPLVTQRLIELLTRLAARVDGIERRRSLRAAADRIVATLDSNAMIPADRTPLIEAARAAVAA